ncbi:ABC transporter transmembrane domain-containing protein [Nocardioides ferulae]|uniref:ABC transporter transmembrane domain-containing protein n=1 Tax=Nocardioides ferulae TaxID=2340821 RepID=UPI000EAD748B|nr:ABC transporter ATP-binding protein [Nocardioides ferulae]
MTVDSSSAARRTELPSTSGALLRRTVRRQRGRVAGSAALVTVWQIAELMVPVLIGVVIERGVVTGEVDQMLLWGGVLALHFVVLSYSYRFGARWGFRALQAESHALRTEVSAHMLSPRGARPDRLPGDVLALATADAESVATVLRQLTFTVAGGVGLLVSAAVLAAIDVVLAALVLVGVPLVLAVTQGAAPRLTRRSEARQEALGGATGLAADFVRGLRPLKGIGAEDHALARYRRQSRQAADASIGAAGWEGAVQGLTAGLSGLFLAAVALVAGLRALDGGLGIGEFVAVVGISQFLGEPLRMLTYLLTQVAQSRASAARIVSFLATPPLVLAPDPDGVTAENADPGAAADPALRGPRAAPDLRLEAVHHGSLAGLDLVFEPGRLVAVVAEDPSDAAALMALLRAEAVPTHGSVLLEGAVLTSWPVDRLQEMLLVADHHVDLFEGTLLTNLDPRGELSDDGLRRVLTASAADQLVSAAGAGLAEPVGADGTTLSGGQRQRLGLARALAADAPLLVLHDPTTAIDAVTETMVAEGLWRLRHGPERTAERTTVVVTGSPALLARADVVVHVRGGRAVATGRHAVLVSSADYREAVLR